MPIYEYECEACGHRYDILQKAGDPLLTVCPECSQPTLKKLVSAARFRLSGSGWYETDFKAENKRNLASSDSQKPSDGKHAKSSKKSNGSKQPSDTSVKTPDSRQST